MKFFEIGETVHIPKYKVIGRINDKYFQRLCNNELRFEIEVLKKMTKTTYGSCIPDDIIYVSLENLKSIKCNEIYKGFKNNIKNWENEDIFIESDLHIPNLLTKNDITEGTKVKLVDNYFLERMISYPEDSRLFNNISLTSLLNKEYELTGEYTRMRHGGLVARCRIDYESYYIYTDCLQVVKRVGFFKKLLNRFDKLNGVEKIALICGLSMILSGIIFLMTKCFHLV